MKDKHSAALWMFALLGFSCLLVSMDRRIFWVLASGVRYELGLTQLQVQMASEATQFGLGAASLAAGYLVRAFNRKGVAMVGLLIASMATSGAAYALDFHGMFAARLMVGIGIALNLVAMVAIGISNFPRHRSNVVAAVLFFTGAGSLIAVNLGTIIDETTGWDDPLIAFGLAGLPMAVAVFILLKPWFSEAVEPRRLDSYPAQLSLAKSMCSYRVLLLGGMTVLLSLCISSFRDNYLYHVREESGFTWQFGQLAVSAYAFGNLFAFYGASVFERYGARRVLIASLALTVILSFFIFITDWEYAGVHVVLSMLLGISLGGIATVALLSEMIGSVVAAQRGPVIGLFFGCLFLPNIFSNGLCQSVEGAIGHAAAGLLLMSGSALIAAVLATRLPTPPKKHHRV